MAGFPNPITNENFPAAWNIVCRKYKHAKVKAAIRKIAKPIGELLFFPAFLMLAFGASVTYTTPNVSALIRRIPVVPGMWQQLETVLFGSADTVLDHILRYIPRNFLPQEEATLLRRKWNRRTVSELPHTRLFDAPSLRSQRPP